MHDYDDYDDGDFWSLEQELHYCWVNSVEGREWANKWLQDLGAIEVPSDVYAAIADYKSDTIFDHRAHGSACDGS
jgi:hypothetical protein